MDPLPTLHPANDTKPKLNQKVNKGAPKIGTIEPQIQSRHNRVFGTTRSINIIEKPVSNKTSITKPKTTFPSKQPKPIQTTKPPFDTSTKLIEPIDNKKTPENVVTNPKLNKKSDALIKKQRQGEKPIIRNYSSSSNQEKDSVDPKTPVASSLTRVRGNKGTPFYTAVNCSKCRFDRLETSSYWIGQIKMAESVGKHFIAADFFRLALDSQAEPIRNLRMELRRYLLRNDYLSEQKEWKEVGARYGILKVESTNTTTTTCVIESSSTNEIESSSTKNDILGE